jgi:hypothetical protein
MQLKAGHTYIYNTNNGAVYPYEPMLERVPGMIAFVPEDDGEFNISMTLAGRKTDDEGIVQRLEGPEPVVEQDTLDNKDSVADPKLMITPLPIAQPATLAPGAETEL